jgi:UDP-N-acetylglucosamine 2-epimerase (non-hydrolysing)
MSKIFFGQLEIPKPNINLEIGSGGHGEQTGRIMIEFEKVCLKEKPDLILVYGDVNSTIAAALVAKKLGIKVGHVEAGLRSFDRTMPEELNRTLTDAISDYLFTPSPDADKNLIKEGIPKDKIHRVGNIMVDSLLYHKKQAQRSAILKKLQLCPKEYALLTLHRPSNVDDKTDLNKIFKAIKYISGKIPVIFPIHPRTRKNLGAVSRPPTGEAGKLLAGGIAMIDPLGYLDFLNLMMNARFVLTDSGGIQEETTVLGIPCLTLRNTTERPITIMHGTNTLVWNDTKKIIKEANMILKGKGKNGHCPDLWDGRTAERIVRILTKTL